MEPAPPPQKKNKTIILNIDIKVLNNFMTYPAGVQLTQDTDWA